MSHSTSMPSAAKKPSSFATKSFRPIPLGATRTFLIDPPVSAGADYTSALTYEDDLARAHCLGIAVDPGRLRVGRERRPDRGRQILPARADRQGRGARAHRQLPL